MKKVVCSLANNTTEAWAPGALLVALSRARDIGSLFINGPFGVDRILASLRSAHSKQVAAENKRLSDLADRTSERYPHIGTEEGFNNLIEQYTTRRRPDVVVATMMGTGQMV